MAKKSSKDYFGLGRLLSLILAIIPFTAWLLGAFTRISDGHIVAGLIRLFFGGFILWIFDLILMITQGKIVRILKI